MLSAPFLLALNTFLSAAVHASPVVRRRCDLLQRRSPGRYIIPGLCGCSRGTRRFVLYVPYSMLFALCFGHMPELWVQNTAESLSAGRTVVPFRFHPAFTPAIRVPLHSFSALRLLYQRLMDLVLCPSTRDAVPLLVTAAAKLSGHRSGQRAHAHPVQDSGTFPAAESRFNIGAIPCRANFACR